LNTNETNSTSAVNALRQLNGAKQIEVVVDMQQGNSLQIK